MRISDWSSDVCSSDLIVVEPDAVVEARGLGHCPAEQAHPFGAVVEPPGGAELQRGVMARERSELARIARLVQSEEDDRVARLLAVTPAQRTQGMEIVGAWRDVGALAASLMVATQRFM